MNERPRKATRLTVSLEEQDYRTLNEIAVARDASLSWVSALAAAQTKGRERYDGFVEALGRRLARGRKLVDEVSQDVDAAASEGDTALRR
jgi:predicted DNA-binding ribbon-helix-helix protein